MNTRIVSWNLAHQMKVRAISPSTLPALQSLEPDVIVLTEFAPAETDRKGRSRKPFFDALKDAKWNFLLPDIAEGGFQNHVLIASRDELKKGDLTSRDAPYPAICNFLHVSIESRGIEVIGLRVPCWNAYRREMREYWNWFSELLETECHRPLVIVGDVNADPRSTHVRYQREYVSQFRQHWQIPDPMPPESGSYVSKNGHWSRIDHAFVSERIRVLNTSYVARHGDFIFASQEAHLSDHAVLKLDVAAASDLTNEKVA